MKKDDVWDKNWLKNSIPDVHPEIISLVKKYAPGKKILEIGYGTGGDLSALNKESFSCWGLEKSRVAYRLSKKNKAFKSVFGDAENAPFKDKEFDLIFHQGVLEHFKNPHKFVSEQYRMLKKQGIIIIDVPHKWNLFTIYKHFRMFFGNWYGGWERSYSTTELKTLVKREGFKLVKVTYRGIWPHRWGKFLYPKKIVNRKWASGILSTFPLNFFQKSALKIYGSSKFLRLLSSYNVIIVAKK